MGFGKKDQYGRDPVVSAIWNAFGAVPVLPQLSDLDVLQVLRQDNDGFHILGSVGDLCKAGPKKDELVMLLQNYRSGNSSDIAMVEGPSNQKSRVKNKRGVLASLGIAGFSGSMNFANAKELEIELPSQRLRSVSPGAWPKFMDGFNVDVNLYRALLPGGGIKNFELWVVQTVVLCPTVDVTAVRERSAGASASAPVPAGGPVVFEVKGELQVTSSSEVAFSLKGPEVPGTSPAQYQDMALAFRGWKYRFNLTGNQIGLAQPSQYRADGESLQKPEANMQTGSLNMFAFQDGYEGLPFVKIQANSDSEDESDDDTL
jgi:hypothetical protein